MRIGIIGGKGKMGQMFADFFAEKGHDVIISDVGTELNNEQLANQSDAILFCVPIDITTKIIASVIPFTRKEQILLDITSLKQPAVEAMLYSECEVLGLHPMFGPTGSFRSQIMIACKAREREKSSIFLDMFTDAGLKITFASPSEHDKMMAIIQGLTHFNTIVLGHAFKDLGISMEDTLKFASPIYQLRLAMVGRIFAQDPRLYADIELENPFVFDMLSEVERSTEKLIQLIRNKDKQGFIAYFSEAGDFFREYKEQSMYATDKMIRMMKDG